MCSRTGWSSAALGVEFPIDSSSGLLERLREVTSGDLPTAVFDATGNPTSMMGAFEFVAHGGRLVYVGLFPGDVTFHDPHFHRREITLLATRNSTSQISKGSSA